MGMGPKQLFHPPTQFLIARTSLIEIGRSFRRGRHSRAARKTSSERGAFGFIASTPDGGPIVRGQFWGRTSSHEADKGGCLPCPNPRDGIRARDFDRFLSRDGQVEMVVRLARSFDFDGKFRFLSVLVRIVVEILQLIGWAEKVEFHRPDTVQLGKRHHVGFDGDAVCLRIGVEGKASRGIALAGAKGSLRRRPAFDEGRQTTPNLARDHSRQAVDGHLT